MLLLIALAAAAYAGRRVILRSVGRCLIDTAGERPCDAIVIMNGNISTRPYRAAELYKRHNAPVLLARLADTEEVRLGVIPNVSDATRELLLRLGVDRADIELLRSDRWVAGTWAEAILLCARIRSRGWRRVAIVTDAFHTRRARWAFRKVMRDDNVEFFCVATPWSLKLADRWWQSEYGLVQVITEYIKFLHYRRLQRAAKRGAPPAESDLADMGEARGLVSGKDDRG
jgi:uncharacterized SAM-binding protein YcdF (DUF218 family)